MSEPLPKDASPFDYPLMTIGQLNMRQATPWIISLAGQHPKMTQECVRTLGWLGDPGAIPFLGKTLLDDREPPLTRELAAGALGWTTDDAAFPYMQAALQKADAELADSILARLSRINPELAMPVWVESMERLGLLDGSHRAAIHQTACVLDHDPGACPLTGYGWMWLLEQ
jgi:HEAT repeat protein